MRVIDLAVPRMVVQVCTRPKGDSIVLDCLVKILEQRGIGPGLVARMQSFGLAGRTPTTSPHDRILLAAPTGRPLLQFDDHDFRPSVFVFSRNDEVDTLRRPGHLVLDPDSDIAWNIFILKDLRHLLKGLLP